MVDVHNNSALSSEDFDELRKRLELIRGLNIALEWALSDPKAKNIPEVVFTQDEYSHDVIFAYGDMFVVFDTT